MLLLVEHFIPQQPFFKDALEILSALGDPCEDYELNEDQ